ncbi:hypothetical protein [Paraburkholderia acidipaludis]|uniref:hypothetical protein n=1 Tax=Paraburkholderia acidipaludis TaxID=660537 RepID=UPI0012EC80B3|nr:hypothetical protein [Paraburkholderia acidipaludis]
MTLSAITQRLRALRTETAPTEQNARTNAAATPQPAPEKSGGLLAGLKKLPLDMPAGSMYRLTKKGPVTLPHHKKPERNAITMPALELAAEPDIQALAYPPAPKGTKRVRSDMKKAAGAFNQADAAATAQAPGAQGDVIEAAVNRCFPNIDPGPDAARLSELHKKRLLRDVRNALPEEGTVPDEVREAQGELLLQALAEATGGLPGMARNTFRRMQQGLEFTNQPGVGAVPDRATRDAWRTAQLLSQTANGYDCLRSLVGRNAAGHGRAWPQGDADAARYAPKVWLQAANELVKATGCAADPASIAQTAATPGVRGAHAAWVAQAAAKLWQAGSADGLTDDDKGALFAGRQGFLSDGEGTPFALTKSRIERFVNHTIPRAASDRPELEPADGEAAVPVAPRRKGYEALTVRPFGYGKTAVAGMNQGVEGASADTWAKDKDTLNNAVRGLFVAMDGNPVRPEQGSSKLRKDSSALHQVVEEAELAALAQRSDPANPTIGMGTKLDDATLDDIVRRVAAKLGGEGEGIEGLARRAVQRPGQPAAEGAGGSPGRREQRVRDMLTAFRDKLAADNPDPAARAAARKLVRKYLSNGSDVVDTAKVDKLRSRFGAGLSEAGQKHLATYERIGLGKPITPGRKTSDTALDGAMSAMLVAMDGGNRNPAPPAPGGRNLLRKDSAALRHIVANAELGALAALARPATQAEGQAAQPARQPVAFGMKLDDNTLDDIGRRVAQALDNEGAIDDIARTMAQQSGRGPRREARIRDALTAFRRKLTVNDDPRTHAAARKAVRKYLANNGSDVVDAATIDELRSRFGNGLPPEGDPARAGLQRQIGTYDRLSLARTEAPKGTATEDYNEAADRIVDALGGSGKAIMTDGGQFGVYVRGLSAAKATGVGKLISPRLNFQWLHGNQSILAFSRSTAAYAVSFGTQQRDSYGAGVGLQVGPSFGAVRVAGNVDAVYQADTTHQHTVDISVARKLAAPAADRPLDLDAKTDDKRARDQAKEVNDFLFGNAGKGKSERALWNEMGRRFFDHDDVSVSWNGQSGSVHRADVVADARASAKFGLTSKGYMRINAYAGGAVRHVTGATLDTADEAGQTRIESHRFGKGTRVSAQAAASVTVGGEVQRGSASDPTDIATVSAPAVNVIGIEMQVADTFQQAKVTLVRDNGKLRLNGSNADVEVPFSTYKKELLGNPAWRLAFGVGSHIGPRDPMPTGDALRQALDDGGRRIEAYLNELEPNVTQNLKFVLRRRIRAHAAAKADALADRIAAMKARDPNDETGEIRKLTTQRDALLKRDDSWLPTELLPVQTTERQALKGPRVGGIQTALQSSARGEVEVSGLKLAPLRCDELDRVWPMQND